MSLRRALGLFLALSLLFSILPSPAQAKSQPQAEKLLAAMSPAEKVGQLFLIRFSGSNVSEGTILRELITARHIGGFVLSAESDNFSGTDTLASAYTLIAAMQSAAWEKTQHSPDTTLRGELPVYIPLYIGIEQSGKHSSQILPGLSDQPDQMTLGATWSPSLAQQSGELLGSELSALGINLFLGPTLDVAETTNLEAAAYSGTDVYGGDPYWVGKIGQAFITGLHVGSGNRMSVVAQHFPGLGSADRPPDEEVATVRKSLEQLKQIELAPFFSVTSAEDPGMRADGLMVSHIRFQGFQGNIRATTRPISFDATALSQLLAVEPLASWREAGGLTVSQCLGSKAVRSFFDPTGHSFDANTIARTAFLAGNDMLYLKDFSSPGEVQPYETILQTLDYFTSKYEEDPAFAQRVDAAVLRILNAKLRLYGEFSLETVIPDRAGLQYVGRNSQLAFNIAREAVTLISPSQDYLNSLLPSPPGTYEYLVIFSDQRALKLCSTCQPEYTLATSTFQNTLLRLYGQGGSNQLLQNRLSSYSFNQLSEILDQKTELSDPYMADNLKRADWVVFNIQNLNPARPESYALRRILSERLDLIRDKKIVVFAYDAPYYLDATEISKLSAYFALYSSNQSSVDVAARVLMQEIQASGSLPVSLPAVGYDLISETSPNPEQVIPIVLISSRATTAPEASATPGEVTPMPLFALGETVRIQAGVIRDNNQHLVPDGTVVQFTIRLAGDQAIIGQPQAVTKDGFATVEYRIERDGIFEVTASSEPAMTSGTLILNTQGGLAQLIMPTATPTFAPSPTPMPALTAETSPTPASGSSANSRGYPEMDDWLLSMMVMSLGFAAAYASGFFWWGSRLWGARAGVCALIGGFTAYLLLTLGLPGLEALVREGGTWFVVQVALSGMLFGWLAALVWWFAKKTAARGK